MRKILCLTFMALAELSPIRAHASAIPGCDANYCWLLVPNTATFSDPFDARRLAYHNVTYHVVWDTGVAPAHLSTASTILGDQFAKWAAQAPCQTFSENGASTNVVTFVNVANAWDRDATWFGVTRRVVDPITGNINGFTMGFNMDPALPDRDASHWVASGTPDPVSGIDLTTIALHECGHVLGLDDIYHTAFNTVMQQYPYGTTKTSLDTDDVAAMAYLYATFTCQNSEIKTWGGMKAMFPGYRGFGGVGVMSAQGNTLAWNHLPNDSQRTYAVFRSIGDDEDLELVGTTFGDTLFIDDDVVAGTQYHYHVATADTTVLSEVVSGSAGLKLVSDLIVDESGGVDALVVKDNSAYMSTWHSIHKYDVADPANPIQAASRSTSVFDSEWVPYLAVSDDGGELYAQTGTGFVVLNATSPGLAVLDMLGDIATGGLGEEANGMLVDGDVVYASYGTKGIYAFDVSNPNAVRVAGTYKPEPESSYVGFITMSGGQLLVEVFDLTAWTSWLERLSVDALGQPPYFHVDFSLDCTGPSEECGSDEIWLPVAPSAHEAQSAYELGFWGGEHAIIDMADRAHLAAVKTVDPFVHAPALVITDPTGAPTDTVSYCPAIVDYDFDSHFLYATASVWNDPFDRSLVAFDIRDAATQDALFAAGDTLGGVLPGRVQSHGKYVYVLEDFMAKGEVTHEARMRIYEKANGCQPDPDNPVRLAPANAAYRLGDEVGVVWAVGCPTSVAVALVEDGVAEEQILADAYPYADDKAYTKTWTVHGIASDLENHSYQVRVTASYDGAPDQEFFSPPFRVEVGNQLEVAKDGSKPYTTIQSAINASQSGDSVIVYAGSYIEQVALRSNVHLVGRPGAILKQPLSEGAVVRAENLLYPPSLIGLLVEHDWGTAHEGLQVTGCGVYVADCTFAGLEPGVEILDGYGTFEACEFTGNTGADGSGLRIGSVTPGTVTRVTDCTFIGNVGAASVGGAASYDATEAPITFTRCSFFGNTGTGAVGVLVGANVRPMFAQCLFGQNVMSTAGSVVGGTGSTGAVFRRCTFADNTGGSASAVVSLSPMAVDSAVVVDRCIFSGNATTGALGSAGAQYVMVDSDFFGNGADDGTCIANGVNCFGGDPVFCNSSTYTVSAASPCAPGVTASQIVGAGELGCVPIATVALLDGFGGLSPDSLLFGCPAGDADSFSVLVDFDNSSLTRDIEVSELALSEPYYSRGIFSSNPILADHVVSGPDYSTTIGYRFVSGTGVDSLVVQLNGYPLPVKPVLQRRGPDMDGDGEVDVQDLAIFGTDYQSPPKPYMARSDFDGNGAVTGSDFAAFGAHIGHMHPFQGPMLAPRIVRTSAMDVTLSFEELDPLGGEHRIRATLSVNSIELFKAMFMAFSSENPAFEFVEWHANPNYPQVTMGARTEWNGRSVIMIGALGSKNQQSSYINLGYFDVVVHSETALEPSMDDFVFIDGDLLEIGGAILGVQGSSVRRTYSAPTYRTELGQNYPNPFNPVTTIAYSLEKKVPASLVIYDVRGARVRTLVDEVQEQGNHRVRWDGHNGAGNPVASGVYFYRLIAGSYKSSKKMVLLR